MKKTIIIILVIAVFIGGLFIFYNSRSGGQKPLAVSSAGQQTNTLQNWAAQTDDQSGVAVTVTPIDVSPESKEWKFDVAMNTHSVALDQDLMRVAVLIDDQSKEYQPLNWEGSVGGHHREGVLTFNRIAPIPKSIELKISGIGDVSRSFTWQFR